ncbi:MAG: hypothetical protein EYC69_08495 [Bacteroidetes bacterium]|nr:MAG: hypothetical protein EYC69_08495 [Bacteroidota bacterium]
MLQELQNNLRMEDFEVKGMKQLYFILWTIGEKFPAQKTLSNHELPRHENYLKQAYRDGRLLVAALFENGSGVITLMEAETEYEIHKFVRNNPEVMDKKIQARIKPCRPVHWKNIE